MPTQAIAFDLDDTLLHDDRSISSYTLSVLRRAAAQGVHIIPASGRTSASMAAFVEQIGCARCYVCCNGAEVRTPDHRLIMQKILPVPLAREVAAFANEQDCYAQTYYGDMFYYSRHGKYADDYAVSSSLKGQYAGDLTKFIDRPTTKILLMDEPARIAQLLSMAREQWGHAASLTCSKPYFLEINPLNATKGEALAWCGRQFGFAMADLTCFGDSLNDLSMLQAAGTGVAVANAREDVKALIPTTCPSNQEDGVARYIEQHILTEESI